jgi:hypothetical protein
MWAGEHMPNIKETTLHPEKCRMWCASLAGSVFFFYHTVTADHCLHEEFLLFLQRVVSVLEENCFQQDRTLLHNINPVLGVLSDHFISSMFSDSFPQWFEYGWSWLPYSPHLVTYDYF